MNKKRRMCKIQEYKVNKKRRKGKMKNSTLGKYPRRNSDT
jgi:hypothetical protein